MTIWRMRISRWVPKAINTHSKYVKFIAFLLQQGLHKRTSVLRYTYTARVVTFCSRFQRMTNFTLQSVHYRTKSQQ